MSRIGTHNHTHTQAQADGESHKTGSPRSNSENTGNRLVGVKVDATTARVTSPSNPKVHATVKVFHPSMLLAD